jgi:hydrogenase maturation protein HypF
MDDMPTGLTIRVAGLVQGVGFRPFVWNLAASLEVTGRVLNDGGGVLIEAFGSDVNLASFVERLSSDAPPLARVDAVSTKPVEGHAPETFEIAASEGGAVSTGIVPDAATCPACLADIRDPSNRRYRYPFTNCTHCGPRLSIVEKIPYDRATTSMRMFPMCDECREEYEDPADRRFHAQPNACPVCGPRIWLEDDGGEITSKDVIEAAAGLLLDGRILAIRGLGGFHLACDATSEPAVKRLRERKRRDAKPLAVMMPDIETARHYASIGEAEAKLLLGPVAPIVLLAANASGMLAGAVASGHDHIGIMLPYTPLHHMILQAVERPLVMTSGNLSSEPQVTGNAEARQKLSGICDAWLMHDREIVNRLDDSVVRIDTHGPSILRRARGMAPEPLLLPEGFDEAPSVLAFGGDLKSAFCLFGNGRAIVSQHMGDLEEALTQDDFSRNLALYRNLFEFEAKLLAADLHEGYFSTRMAREALQAGSGTRLIAVQHHHAHLAACLLENGISVGEEKAVGVILDGTGAGTDGTVWGGEILVGGYGDFERVAHFIPVALPGGDRAAKEPWRNAVAHLKAAFGDGWREAAASAGLQALANRKEAAIIERMIDGGVNSPLSSSAGRLFDAVAALLGVAAEKQFYEGQTGMELEALARPHIREETAYPHATAKMGEALVVTWEPLWRAMLKDLSSSVEKGRIAARFHLSLIDALAWIAVEAANIHGTGMVALSGGVMQNAILANGLRSRLSQRGLQPLMHSRVPANDGGLALGQAAIAAVNSVLPGS